MGAQSIEEAEKLQDVTDKTEGYESNGLSYMNQQVRRRLENDRRGLEDVSQCVSTTGSQGPQVLDLAPGQSIEEAEKLQDVTDKTEGYESNGLAYMYHQVRRRSENDSRGLEDVSHGVSTTGSEGPQVLDLAPAQSIEEARSFRMSQLRQKATKAMGSLT